MKFTKSAGLIFFAFLLLNCSNDEGPSPEPTSEEKFNPKPKPEEPDKPEEQVYFSYFSDPYEYDAYSYSQWNDNWVILHNQDGELLDYREFAIGDSLEFKESVVKLSNVQTLSVTILKHSLSEGGGDLHIMETSSGIKKGTIWGWTVNEPTVPIPQPTKSVGVSITVNNVPNVHWFDISSLVNNHVASNPFYQETDALKISSVPLYEGISYILSLRDGNEEIKYQLLELPNPFSNIDLDYGDFLDYDQVLEVEIPEYKGYVARVSAGNKSINYSNKTTISSESSGRLARRKAKLGYINDFDTFVTNLVLHYDDQTVYSRYKTGAIPISINVPENPQFEVGGSTIYDYSFTTNQEYYRNTSTWTYENEEKDIITRYSIGGKTDNGALVGELPDQLLENFPNLNLGKLNREATLLYIGENVDNMSDDRQTIGGATVWRNFEIIRFKTQ